MLHFYPLNELISNVMPAKGLKKVELFEIELKYSAGRPVSH